MPGLPKRACRIGWAATLAAPLLAGCQALLVHGGPNRHFLQTLRSSWSSLARWRGSALLTIDRCV